MFVSEESESSRESKTLSAKDALIEAGIEEFAERGIEGARIRQLADRSGQNIAAVSYHFGGKDGLYRAIADKLAGFVSALLQPRWREAEALLVSPHPDPVACAAIVREILLSLVDAIVASQRMRFGSLLLLREQQHPTAVFDIIYASVIGPTHDRLTRLLAIVWQQPIDALLIARTHALIGQVIAFRGARETILRRAGWTSIGPAELSTIRAAINANLDALLRPVSPS